MTNAERGSHMRAAISRGGAFVARLRSLPARAAAYARANPLHVTALLCGLIPPGILFNLVIRRAANVPFFDAWESSYHVAVGIASGQITLKIFLRPHNEHRIVVSKLLTALATVTTGWDGRVEIGANLVLGCINLALLLWLIRKRQPRLFWPLLAPFSVLFFSLRQYENWLWGFPTNFFLVATFLLAAIVTLSLRPAGWRTLIVAAVWAVCASYSMLAGFLAWGLIPAGMWLLGYRNWRHYAFWALAAALTAALYFTDYTRQGSYLGAPTRDPIQIAYYAAVYLAGPFFSLQQIAGVPLAAASLSLSGVGLVAINMIVVWRKDRDTALLAPWLMIAAIGLGMAAMTSLGRAQLGLIQAGSPRYVSLSLYFWAGGAVLAALATRRILLQEQRRRWESSIAAANIMFLVFATSLAIQAEYASQSDVDVFSGWLTSGEACLRKYPLTQDIECAEQLFPSKEELVSKIPKLVELRLNVYAQPYEAPLSAIPIEPAQPQTGDGFTTYPVDGRDTPVLAQRGPSVVSIHLHPMKHNRRVLFRAAAFEDPGAVTQESIEFRVAVVEQNGTRTVLYGRLYHPQADLGPVPLEVDLSAYAGKIIRLELAIDPRGGGDARALWVNPVFAFVDDPR